MIVIYNLFYMKRVTSDVDEVVDVSARGQLQQLEQTAGRGQSDLCCLESGVSEGRSAETASVYCHDKLHFTSCD